MEPDTSQRPYLGDEPTVRREDGDRMIRSGIGIFIVGVVLVVVQLAFHLSTVRISLAALIGGPLCVALGVVVRARR